MKKYERNHKKKTTEDTEKMLSYYRRQKDHIKGEKELDTESETLGNCMKTGSRFEVREGEERNDS